MSTPLRRRLRSLRLQLPMLLLGYCTLVGPAIYLIVDRTQERQFEREFAARQLARATELQDRTERAAERNELETAQREFGELAENEALRAAVFIAPDNRVLLASRREWRDRPLDTRALGVAGVDRAGVEALVQSTRETRRPHSLFTAGGNGLVLLLPAALPLARGAVEVDRSAVMVLVYDLTLSKAINTFRLRQLFLVIAAAVIGGVVALGIALHFFVTRRLEHIQELIGRFAAGETLDASASRLSDEIGDIGMRFQAMARTVRHEMSERLEATTALRESEDKFRTAMRHSPIGQALMGADGRFMTVNAALCDMLGYAEEELLATSYDTLTHPDDRAADAELNRRIVSGEIETFQTEKRYLHKSGRVVWAQLNAAAVYRDNRPTFFVTQPQDITDRKHAEDALKALNVRYARHEAALAVLTRCEVESPDQFAAVARIITETVQSALDVNRAGIWRRGGPDRFFCVDLYEAALQRHSADRTIAGSRVNEFEALLGEGGDVMAVHDVRADTRMGTFVTEFLGDVAIRSFLAVPIRTQGRITALLTCCHCGDPRQWTPDEQTFISAVANLLASLFAQVARLDLEAQLQQATKLEGIGQLAGGVAHDFNNVLTVILGKASTLAADPRLPADLREAADDITHSGERAANLTRQLLAFSRRQSMQVHDLDLNTSIRGVSRMLQRLLGEDLTVELDLANRPIHVRADAGMIDQVVVNLAVNARDAMPAGGRLTIQTSLVEFDPADSSRAARMPGPYAVLRVSDTGSGIEPHVLAHIFEPFFTTKEIGKGTGLGLATTYGIVQQHNGWIEVDSRVGTGTTFQIYLPSVIDASVTEGPRDTRQARVASVPSMGPMGATILVVEDESEVRSLIVDALTGLGYHVLQAESGPAAMALWEREQSSIDLLVTDMVMPGGMNGLELASQLRATKPTLRVIYMSGYLADVSTEELSRGEGASYLSKPFTVPALARLARQALDTVPRPPA